MNYLKILAGFLSALITIAYIVGFLYDAAFLEHLGVLYYEMVGSSLEYLTIGGMFLLLNFALSFAWITVLIAIFSCAYKPALSYIREKEFIIQQYIDVTSIPYVVFGTIPMLMIAIIPISNKANQDADEHLNSKTPRVRVCIQEPKVCYSGNVIKYREGKLIFLSKEKSTYNKVLVIPEKNISMTEQLNYSTKS